MVIAPQRSRRARARTWCGSRRASPPRSAPTRRARSPPWCGSPGCRARASPRSPMRSNRRWCSAAITPICWTATTSATASTRISISPKAGATRTSAASARCRRCSSTPACIVITAFISPFRADRNQIRERIGDAQFIEVYLSTSLEECERRDPKGLYVKARAGEIREFTGIDSPYEPPIASAAHPRHFEGGDRRGRGPDPALPREQGLPAPGGSGPMSKRRRHPAGQLPDPGRSPGSAAAARHRVEPRAVDVAVRLLRRRRRRGAVQHSRVPGQSAGRRRRARSIASAAAPAASHRLRRPRPRRCRRSPSSPPRTPATAARSPRSCWPPCRRWACRRA